MAGRPQGHQGVEEVLAAQRPLPGQSSLEVPADPILQLMPTF